MLSLYSLQAIGYNCHQLQSLSLGWCEGVSDEGVKSLAYGCPDLRALDLCGCVLITGTGSIIFVLVVFITHDYGHWNFPINHIDASYLASLLYLYVLLSYLN